MRLASLPIAVVAVVLTACGNVVVDASSAATGVGGATTSHVTSTNSGTGGGACILPTVGEPCASSQVACQPPDPCCAGYEWFCMAGTWQEAGLGCACMTPMPLPCGNTTCPAGSYCEDHPPGILPLDGGPVSGTYTCSPVPASCQATPTCTCVEATLPAQDPCSFGGGATCTEDGSGGVTIVCLDV